MKKVSSIILLFSVILFSLTNCNKDEDVTELTLLTLTSGNVDLYGATTAVDVLVDQPIVAVFSTNIDEATVATALSLTKGGSDVAFTTSVDGATVTITVTGGLITGTNYSLGISAALKSTQGAIFGAATVTFTTIGVGIDTPPQSDNQILYLQFDNSVADVIGNHTNAYSEVTYSIDRFGNTNSAASFNGAGNVVEIAYQNDLFPQDITISFWMKVEPLERNGTDGVPREILGLGANNGYFLEYFNFSWGDGPTWVEGLKFVTNHVNEGTNVSEYGNSWDEYKGEGTANGTSVLTNVEGSVSTMIDSKWVQMVLTYNSLTSIKTIYIDGVKVRQVKINYTEEVSPEWNLTTLTLKEEEGMVKNFTIGAYTSESSVGPAWTVNEERTFKGLMDDFRIFDVTLSDTDVTTLYNTEKVN